MPGFPIPRTQLPQVGGVQPNPRGPVIGVPDGDRNVWRYMTTTEKPGGPNSPFKPKKVTYLVNQNGVHYQDWFQRNFGIDKAGHPVNPLAQPNRTITPPGVPANTPPPQGHAAPHHAATGVQPHDDPAATPPPPPPPPIGNVHTDPALIKAVQAALASGSAGLGGDVKVPQLPSIDPKLYAATLAHMGFDPQISNLLREEQGTKSILPGQLANLNKWYGAVQDQASQGAAADTAAYQQAQAGSTNDAQRIISSLAGGDPGAGYQLAQHAENNNSTLASQQANQASINSALKTDIAGNLAGAKQGATQQNNAQLSDLMTQLSAAMGQRGQAQAQGYQEGIKLKSDLASQGLQNRSVAQNMKLAAALAGPQIAGANLSNLASANNITNSNKSLALTIAKTKADEGRAAAATADQIKNSAVQRQLAIQGAKGKSFQQNLQDPGFQSATHSAIWSGGMVDATGRMAANPQRSYELILGSLKAAHPNAPAGLLARYAQSEVARAVPTSIYANKGWKFRNGKFSK